MVAAQQPRSRADMKEKAGKNPKKASPSSYKAALGYNFASFVFTSGSPV
jgi:hypothetical protein|nr:hypothetical protein [Herbaspirillum sp. B39]